METKTIRLSPVEMTPHVMEMLEEKGLIIRLAPSRHSIPIEKHGCVGKTLYTADKKYGGHKLIVVVVDRVEFSAFGFHEDNEDIWLLGGEGEKTLYLLVALCGVEEFQRKTKNGSLCGEDLICLTCKWNDPQVSFFTMCAGVPHGEATAKDDGCSPASFYVTEPADMELKLLDFGKAIIEVGP